MSADALLRDWIAPSRRRRFADTLLLALPLLFAIAAISWRLAGLLTTGVLLLGGAALALVVARQRAARHDRVWLIRTLDAARPERASAIGQRDARRHAVVFRRARQPPREVFVFVFECRNDGATERREKDGGTEGKTNFGGDRGDVRD